MNAAISSASPGSTIVLANGTWNDVFIDIDKNGGINEPITIAAQNPGSVLMTGNSRVYMEGSYLTVTGPVFKDASDLDISGSNIRPVIELRDCNNCKVISNKIDAYNGTEAQKALKFKWILNDGENNEIAYNSFLGKYGVGSIINDNRNTSGADYLKIHHNVFADRTPINGLNEDNDQDAIRIGQSNTSLDDSYTEVYQNYFYNFFGEIEVISNKSGQNKYYNNTFRNYSGASDANFDAGAEEYGSTGELLPYTIADVEVNVGFKSNSNSITTSESSLEFGVCGSSSSFEIFSNVEWEIVENLSWLDLDILSGEGSLVIRATSSENESGSEQVGEILIQEVGNSDLSHSLSVVHLTTSTELELELEIIGTTSIGMQDKEGVEEVNAYNDDLTNYWTGDAEEEPEVSITFDLGELYFITRMGINFWLANERSTTFSLAIAEERIRTIYHFAGFY